MISTAYTFQVLETQQTQEGIIQAVLESVRSPHTRRAYGRALSDFMAWCNKRGISKLSKMAVQSYISELAASGMGAAAINQRLSAIKKLATEATDAGILDEFILAGIKRIEGIEQNGQRLGNWLSLEQAQKMIYLPNTNTLKGIRDRAILAVLIGCGLRRDEAVNLTFEHIQQREGRWIIVNLVGKRKRVRSVPMANWCKAALDEWAAAAGNSSGYVFQRVNKGDHIEPGQLTPQALHWICKEYARQLGIKNLAPHDLRRTFAMLAHQAGTPIEQIQLSLGHSSIKTTEIYLGVRQDLTHAPSDRIKLRIAPM